MDRKIQDVFIDTSSVFIWRMSQERKQTSYRDSKFLGFYLRTEVNTIHVSTKLKNYRVFGMYVLLNIMHPEYHEATVVLRKLLCFTISGDQKSVI